MADDTRKPSPRASTEARRRIAVTADSVGTAAPVAGVGTHARDRVRRSQRRAGREGIRLVLPARDRRRRLRARTHPFVDHHQPHGPARHSGRRAHACQGSLRVVGRHSEGDRRARSGAHDLLRDLVHDRAAAHVPPGVAATAPPRRVGAYWRGAAWLLVVLVCMALLGGLRGALGGGLGFGLFAIVSLAVTSGLWWFTAWFLLLGEVRARVLVPTGVITGIAMAAYAAIGHGLDARGGDAATRPSSASSVSPSSLVTWFSGAAICVLIGACAGPVLAEDTGWVGKLIRGGESGTLTAGARPATPATRTRARSSRRIPQHRGRVGAAAREELCLPRRRGWSLHAGEDGLSGLLPSGVGRRAATCAARPCEIPSSAYLLVV